MSGVTVSHKNNLGVVTLNNPTIHNALKRRDVEIIISTLSNWQGTKLNAILFTGTGTSFCSGLFLDEFDSKTWIKNPISLICEEIENCECPVICGLNGGAYGGAVEIALSCDFRVADHSISLAVPAASLGIHYEPSGLQRALNILGPSTTRRLFLLGETISVDTILKTDFVDFWVEGGETVLDKSKNLIDTLHNMAPLAVKGMKKTIAEILNNSLDQESAKKRIEECFNSSDHEEALLARKEKRLSKFKGY